ncbi:DNA-binding protein SMUBP-2 [Chytriomyces hyalinus]|nr:DNA-binding protein SMUBP-2 [Chytriomyces hyalinus]
MDKTLAAIAKSKKKSERRGLHDELKKLRVELREREKKVVSDVISTSNVIVVTLSGCGSFVLKGRVFDSVVIDESSQAIEAVKSEGSSAAKPKVTTLLASDTSSNLPQSPSCASFDRMLAIYGADIKCLLDTQYRMNELIMQFPSDHLHGGNLKAHESVSDHLLCHLPWVQETDESTSAFTLLNTSMCGFRETAPILDTSISHLLASESLQNMGEATLIESHVQKLVAAGMSTTQISVITPYSGQARLLQSQLLSTYPDLEIGTVDWSFDGRTRR